MSHDPYSPPVAPIDRVEPVSPVPIKAGEPHGLGGWLTIVAIGLILTAGKLTVYGWTTFLPLFTSGEWASAASPASAEYQPMWATLIIVEIVGNAFFASMALVLLYLFFKKSRLFPRVYIIYTAANIAFVGGDMVLSNFMFDLPASANDEAARELGRSLITAIIWVPYMLVSKRVKNTFVTTRSVAVS